MPITIYHPMAVALLTLTLARTAGSLRAETPDIEGEVNGLLTYDREAKKFPPTSCGNSMLRYIYDTVEP